MTEAEVLELLAVHGANDDGLYCLHFIYLWVFSYGIFCRFTIDQASGNCCLWSIYRIFGRPFIDSNNLYKNHVYSSGQYSNHGAGLVAAQRNLLAMVYVIYSGCGDLH